MAAIWAQPQRTLGTIDGEGFVCTIREDSDDINDALSMFREGNVLMNEVGLDLEEMVERTDFRQML